MKTKSDSKVLPISGEHILGNTGALRNLILCALSFAAVRLGMDSHLDLKGQGNLEHSPGHLRASVRTDHCTSDKM